jgi:hypothetical protein
MDKIAPIYMTKFPQVQAHFDKNWWAQSLVLIGGNSLPITTIEIEQEPGEVNYLVVRIPMKAVELV